MQLLSASTETLITPPSVALAARQHSGALRRLLFGVHKSFPVVASNQTIQFVLPLSANMKVP
jgi:hypothetical protein